jgi:hypothetical protein
MRPASPVAGVPTDPEVLRHYAEHHPADAMRYAGHSADDVRGDSGVYVTLPTTLEEEALNGGWLASSMPTGPPPRQLFTLGMRGEPDFDDDPSPTTGNSYVQRGSSAGPGPSWD